MTSLALATQGLLDRGDYPALDLASLGLLHGAEVPVVVTPGAALGGSWDFEEDEKARVERERQRRASRDDLRRIVSDAYVKAGQPSAPMVPAQPEPIFDRQAIAEAAQLELRLQGLVADLGRVDAMVAQFEAGMRQRLARRARQDEDAVIILLLAA